MDTEIPKDFKHEELISFVKDRPGHDQRYSINASKIQNELGWKPKYNLKEGLILTVKWYLENRDWFKIIQKNNNKWNQLNQKTLMSTF